MLHTIYTVMALKKILNPEVKYILILFLFSRLFLETAGFVGNSWLKSVSTNPTEWSETNTNIPALDMWGVWDSGWYLNIAKDGYSLQEPEGKPPVVTKGQANIGFFPLYPLSIKIVSIVLKNYYISALVVSNTVILAAAWFLYKLVKQENKEVAKRTVKYLFLFPTSFVLSGIYTESMFLLFLVICFYAATKEKWLLVGVFGYFLALTRPTGFLIMVPLLFVYFRDKNYSLNKIKPDVLLFALLPLGLFTFMLYGYFLSGDLFIYKHVKEIAWYATFSNPVQTLLSMYQFGAEVRKIAVFITIEILLISAFYKKIKTEYVLVILLILGIASFEGVAAAISIPRMSSAVFPLFIILAKITKDRKVDLLLTGILLSFQFILMILWSNGILII